jgi:hypothetical protein
MKQELLLICGSRTLTESYYPAVSHRLDQVLTELRQSNPEGFQLTVMTGDGKGADQLANAWAQNNLCTLWRVPALWAEHGRSAGFKRNARMAERDVTRAIGFFHRTRTPGTLDMLQRMKEKGVKTTFVMFE